jgi:hypothetical protein
MTFSSRYTGQITSIVGIYGRIPLPRALLERHIDAR